MTGSSELGVATQGLNLEFVFKFAFDFGTGSYDEVDVVSSDYLGLFARGNIDNLFGTKPGSWLDRVFILSTKF